MSIGMTYEQFWFDSPTIRHIFDRVYEQKLALKNQDMWLQGLYNYRAFDSALQNFGYGLNGGKGKKPQGYLKNPVPITEIEKELEKQRNIQKTIEFFKKGGKVNGV